MESFKEFIIEESTEIRDAKRVFTKLQSMYPDVPKFPLVFKNLGDRGGGYLETSKTRGTKQWFIDRMVINTKLWSNDPDYTVVHEFAHAILTHTKNKPGHSKEHDKLTFELAKKFNLV